MKKIYIILIYILAATLLSAQIKLAPESLEENSIFGKGLATSGNWAAISAPGTSSNSSFKNGAVFLYNYSDDDWNHNSTISPPDAGHLKMFGHSVAIYSDMMFIGAPGDFAHGPFSGSVYVYQCKDSNWEYVQKIYAGDTKASQYFGHAVSANNNYLAVGAYGASGNSEKSGAVYLFKKENSQWIQVEKVFNQEGVENERFGFDAELQNDNTLVIGAPKAIGSANNTGAAFVYQLNENSFELVEKLFESNGNYGDHFGHSVSIDNNTIAVGAYMTSEQDAMPGAVYIYNYSNSDVKLEKKIISSTTNNDYFGYDVSLSGDYLLIGAPNYNAESGGNAGSAFLYKYEDSSWEPYQDLRFDGEKPIDFFGSSVSIDSLNIIVGARLNGENNEGAAYITKLNSITNVETTIPMEYSLSQNYPNPFNPTTNITFTLKEDTDARLDVFDILGRRIATLVNEFRKAGEYEILFNAANFASGVYLYQLKAGNFVNTKKMILLR